MMNRLFMAVLISLSTLLFACDGESSSNVGGGSPGGVSGGSGGTESSSEAIDARNEAIQQNLTSGPQTDSSTTDIDVEPIAEPIELETIDNENENSLDAVDTPDS